MKRIIALALGLCLLTLSAPAAPAIITPDGYQAGGSLPVYRAIRRDFSKGLDPLLFNRSGISRQEAGKIVFQDGAILYPSPEALFYQEYEGSFDVNASEREKNRALFDEAALERQLPVQMSPLPAMSARIASLASSALSGWPGTGETFEPEKESLKGLTLREAERTLEGLLEKLNVKGYLPYRWLDMSVSRIHQLGESYNESIQAGRLSTNLPMADYTAASERDEGFYLQYARPGLKRESGSSAFYVNAFVTGRGVVYLNVCDPYLQGEVYDTPPKLIEAPEALDALPAAIAASRSAPQAVSIEKAELMYALMRAPDKKDGMVFSPIWAVSYQDEESHGAYSAWAEFSAIDGKVVSATFN